MGIPAAAVTSSVASGTSRSQVVDRVPELDLLRFIAAWWVVIYHLVAPPVDAGPMDELVFGSAQAVTRFGFLGVHLFFMISGFVILWSSQTRTASQFVVARFARLYPSFWVCMLLTAAVVTVVGLPDAPSARTVALNLTMVSTLFGAPFVDGVYWTLWMEMRFYVLIFVVLVTGTMGHVEKWIGLWLAASVLSVAGLAPKWLAFIALAPLAPFFISGCLFFLIRSRGLSAFRVVSVLVSCVLSAVAGVNEQSSFILMKRFPVGTTSTIVVVCVIVAFHVTMAVMALKPSILPPRRIWYILGSLTYPLYLVHNTIGKALAVAFTGYMPFAVSFVLRIVIICGISAVVAAVFERKACAALQRFLQRTLDRAVARFRVVWLRPA